mgnify:FL=1
MRKLYTYLLLSMIVTLPLAGGGIRENMDDCKGKVTLRFRYVGDGTTDIFPEKIEHVTMYVYSIADGSLAAIQKYDDNALAAYQGADVMLFPGRYEVVCWGNALDETTINEGEKIAADGYFENTDIATNDPLYYGTIEIEVPETLVENNYICDFVCSHVKIRVRVEGFDQTTMGVPSLELTQLASFTDFDNVPSDEERCSYHPVLAAGSDGEQTVYTAEFNTLRFNDDNDIMLRLHSDETRVVAHEFPLADFLQEHNIAVEGVNEVTVPILIRFSPIGVTIDDWDSVPVNPDFGKN